MKLTGTPMSVSRHCESPARPNTLAPGNGHLHVGQRLIAAAHHGESAGPPTGAGSGQEISWPLPRTPATVGRARALVGDRLTEWGFGAQQDTAELLISELVTNALCHGTGPIRLIVRSVDSTLRFEVEDASTVAPRIRSVDDTDENGRGLHLIEMLAERWGSTPTPAGKIVWFELATTAPCGTD